MQRLQCEAIAIALALMGMHFGCSSGGSAPISFGPASGGTPVGSAGAGTTAATSSGEANGGNLSTGGSITGSGGTQRTAVGGAQPSSGIGGASAARSVGGTVATTSAAAAGGSVNSSGVSSPSGGSVNSGGSGTSSSSSVGSGGTAIGGNTALDPSVSAAISACIDRLPYGGRELSADRRAPIIKAIVNACQMFAPPGEEWQSYCQMFLVGAINAESSFDTQAGTQGAGNDPSVGLLQIRFSSVVRDLANYGPVNTLERNGCAFGNVTESDSFATKRDMMLDVNCNVAIATWYYFIFGSGNGGPNVVWVEDYCTGGGITGNLHIGMASFLMGGEAAHSSLAGADFYYNEIKSWFDPCVTYSGTHPFELPIKPDVRKYCK